MPCINTWTAASASRTFNAVPMLVNAAAGFNMSESIAEVQNRAQFGAMKSGKLQQAAFQQYTILVRKCTICWQCEVTVIVINVVTGYQQTYVSYIEIVTFCPEVQRLSVGTMSQALLSRELRGMQGCRGYFKLPYCIQDGSKVDTVGP